jgi:hypothetical protein
MKPFVLANPKGRVGKMTIGHQTFDCSTLYGWEEPSLDANMEDPQ